MANIGEILGVQIALVIVAMIAGFIRLYKNHGTAQWSWSWSTSLLVLAMVNRMLCQTSIALSSLISLGPAIFPYDYDSCVPANFHTYSMIQIRGR